MVREAEAHKAEDDKRREDIETKNRAEAYIHQIDDTLNNESANIPQDQKDEVKKLRDELQSAIDNNDMASLKTKLDALEQAAQAMSQQMYQNAGANPNPGSTGYTGGSNDDDVVDADFTEKN